MRPYLTQKTIQILELGPGMGILADLFAIAGYDEYTVVEPNPTMRQALMQRGFTAKDYLIPSLREEDETYDLILLSNVFEHLRDTADASLFVNEAHRVLRPNGLLCIFAPDYLHWQADFLMPTILMQISLLFGE